MGAIQSSINQAIGAATIGAGLYAHSPAGQQASAIRFAQSNLKMATQAANEAAAETETAKTPNEQAAAQAAHEQATEQAVQSASKLAELSPNRQNFDTLNRLKAAQSEIQSMYHNNQEQAKAQAEQSSADEITSKKEQKRNFMEYLGKQPTSLGGTVADLPMSVQQKIASQYNKSQKRQLMNTVDKEAKNGKH